MPMPDYRIQGVPQLQQQQGPLGALGDFAKGKALSAGLEAAFPGSGLAKEAGEAVLPTLLNKGGPAAPLGGGQSKESLLQARQLGALSQEEFLRAMAHAGYMEGGGKVPWWKAAADYAWGKGREGESSRKNMKKYNPYKKDSAAYKVAGGPIPGMTPGPLGMKDMLMAGKGKDVSKVTYKTTGGDITDQVEIAYHAPLAPKPQGE